MSDVETYEPGQEVERYQASPPSLFGTNDPEDIVYNATKVATALAGVIETKHLYTNMRGRKHVNVEGWTLLGSMLGVFPTVVWSRPVYALSDDGKTETILGWEARVSVKNMHGVEIGSAEAMCTRSESTWSKRDDYAIRSMAQTRAVSKAMRHPLGFVMTLAGYDPTPDAEMPKQEEPVAPAEPKVSPTGVAVLETAIEQAAFFDRERWSLANVLATASRAFGRPIERLNELSEKEAKRIMDGAAEVISKGRAEHEQAEQPQTDEEPIDLFAGEET